MSEATRILSVIDQGDPQAASQLLPLVYDELRNLAAQKLTHETPGQTLQATALVHEAFLRLVDVDRTPGHFAAHGRSPVVLGAGLAAPGNPGHAPQERKIVKRLA
jgi:hypothetical protein